MLGHRRRRPRIALCGHRFEPGNKALMHRTESIDYVIVLAGAIDMDMDDSA